MIRNFFPQRWPICRDLVLDDVLYEYARTIDNKEYTHTIRRTFEFASKNFHSLKPQIVSVLYNKLNYEDLGWI
jgi:hypothetical protein